MLSAYGFLYNSVKDRLEAGKATGRRDANNIKYQAQLRTVKAARNTAYLLTLAPLFVWAIFFSELVVKIDEAADVNFAFKDYSTLDVALVVLINVWLIIAGFVGWQANELRKALRDLRK